MSFEIDGNKIVINQPIVDIESAFEFREELDKLSQQNLDEIILDMKNAHSLPSVVLGELMILKEQGVKIKIIIYNEFSYTLFEELGLTNIFDVELKKGE